MRTCSTAEISFIYCSNRLKKASEGFWWKGGAWRKRRILRAGISLLWMQERTGKDMHMTNLDIEKGLLDLTGKVDCICYMTDKENGTFSIKRLFK